MTSAHANFHLMWLTSCKSFYCWIMMQRRHKSHKRKTGKIINKNYKTITAEVLSFQFFYLTPCQGWLYLTSFHQLIKMATQSKLPQITISIHPTTCKFQVEYSINLMRIKSIRFISTTGKTKRVLVLSIKWPSVNFWKSYMWTAD